MNVSNFTRMLYCFLMFSRQKLCLGAAGEKWKSRVSLRYMYKACRLAIYLPDVGGFLLPHLRLSGPSGLDIAVSSERLWPAQYLLKEHKFDGSGNTIFRIQ